MRSRMKIGVTGASGRLGRHLVDVLGEAGHDVVPMSRTFGVDVVTGAGLDAALAGVDCVIDAATGPSPDEREATEFFRASAANIQAAAERAGVRRIVVVSIIGVEHFSAGYNAAKLEQERAMLAGPVPVRILRAAQFHEFVAQLLEWTTRDGVAHLPPMRTQLVAACAVAECLVEIATDPAWGSRELIEEVGGPREETLEAAARLLIERRGEDLRIVVESDPSDPSSALFAQGALLPGPRATLAGPTFAEWLERQPAPVS